jgi:AcrR family transcriptional regulator
MADARTVRWRRRKESRPGELLDAALACFAERGFAATRLEDVAARAGVTKGTAYLYYASKEELFKAVVRGYLVPVIASLEAAADAPGPVFQLLETVVGLFVEKVYDSPLSAIPKLVISEAGNFPELAGFYLEEVIDRGRRLVGKLLNRGVASGEFRELDVEHTVYCLFAPLLFSVLWKHSIGRADAKPLDVAALARCHLEMLRRGLAAEPLQAQGKASKAAAKKIKRVTSGGRKTSTVRSRSAKGRDS